jgi:hypothetical protein
VEIEMAVPVPATAGRHVVELDLVAEDVTWFGAVGSPTVRIDLDVEPPAS